MQNKTCLIDKNGKGIREQPLNMTVEEMVEVLEYDPEEFLWIMDEKKISECVRHNGAELRVRDSDDVC